MDEFQEMLPSLTATAFFTLALVFVARQEEEYTWWKAVLAALAGQVVAVASGAGIELVPPMAGQILAWVSLPVIAAVVTLGCRWMKMAWRDAIIIGATFVILQFLVSFAGAFAQTKSF